MRLKLDENLGQRRAELLCNAAHDVATVTAEDLAGAQDQVLIEISREERRCLVTLDMDFGNPILFKPSLYYGIAVLRLPPRPSHADLLDTIRTLISGLAKENIEGKL